MKKTILVLLRVILIISLLVTSAYAESAMSNFKKRLHIKRVCTLTYHRATGSVKMFLMLMNIIL